MLESVQPRAKRSFGPPRGPSVRYALALVGPLALLVLGCKVHKLVRFDADLGGVLAGVGEDLAFFVVLTALTAVLVDVTRGWGRVATRLILHLAVLFMMALAVVEHGFFLTTGSLLDADLLGYGIAHFAALKEVYASETTWLVWAAGAGVLALNALPLWVCRRGRLAALSSTSRPALGAWVRRPVSVYLATGGALVVGGLLMSAATLPGAAEPLRENVFIAFTVGDVDSAPAIEAAAVEALEPVEAVQLDVRPDAPRPNVVLIFLESMRAKSTTLFDPDLPTTPELAELAARGATVDSMWTTVPHTSKALVSLLCGIHPRPQQEITEAGPEGLPTTCLPQLLRDHGWSTAFIQPATAMFERRDEFVKNAGFEAFISRESLDGEGFEETSYFGFEDDAMLKPALAWVDARPKDRPFLLTVMTLASHHKYVVPKHWQRRKLGRSRLEDDYLNAIAYVDHFVGELIDGLEQRGLFDDTVFIVVGDHGEGFSEHGRRQHDTVIYEEGLHVPAVLVGPGVTPGSHIRGLRQHIDIAPTVLELAGMPVRSGLPGRSLLDPEGHERLYAWCWYGQRCAAVREGDLKVVHHFGRRPDEAFDLAADPRERSDLLASGAAPPDRVKALTEDLLAFSQATERRYAMQIERFRRGNVSDLPPAPARPLDVTFGDKLRLVGVDVAQDRILQGDPLKVTLHFECLEALGERWKLFTHVIGRSPEAKTFANADHVPVHGRFPTESWRAGQFISDVFRYQPRKVLPPGRYAMVIGLWDAEAKGDASETRALPVGDGVEIDELRRVHVLEFEVLPRQGSWGFGAHPASPSEKAPARAKEPSGHDEAGDHEDPPPEQGGASR